MAWWLIGGAFALASGLATVALCRWFLWLRSKSPRQADDALMIHWTDTQPYGCKRVSDGLGWHWEHTSACVAEGVRLRRNRFDWSG